MCALIVCCAAFGEATEKLIHSGTMEDSGTRSGDEGHNLVDSSGHRLDSGSPDIPRILRKPGVPGWTLAILAVQAVAMLLQVWIVGRQTGLMRRDDSILETQQRLATRPYVETRVLDWGPVKTDKPTRWRIENKGPYAIRDLSLRFLDFEKFVNFGWRTIASNDALMLPILEPGKTYDQNLQAAASMVKGTSGDLVPVEGAHFLVIELTFEREVDDQHYLYLEPLWIPDDKTGPQPADQWFGSNGPWNKACSIDAYAMELAYEFYRRNPLRYPVELYNYHYLLGSPSKVCLESSQTMRP
jgi:hypothetical protein